MATVRFRLNDREDAPEVLVEVAGDADADEGTLERAGLGETVGRQAEKTLSRTMDTIPQVANTVLGKLEELDREPSLVEFTMGFTVNASGDLKLVTGGAEAHVTLRMEWSPKANG